MSLVRAALTVAVAPALLRLALALGTLRAVAVITLLSVLLSVSVALVHQISAFRRHVLLRFG